GRESTGARAADPAPAALRPAARAHCALHRLDARGAGGPPSGRTRVRVSWPPVGARSCGRSADRGGRDDRPVVPSRVRRPDGARGSGTLMRALLAHRDARVLIAGQLVSMFGDSAMFLVLGIWAKALTGSNAAAGLVFFVLVAATLAAPLGGLIADRVR